MKATIERPKLSIFSPEKIFPKIAHEPGAVWLDSSLQIGDKGRYSFIARRPAKSIAANTDDLTEKLRELSKLWKNENLFSIGYVSYEGAFPFLGIDPGRFAKLRTPLMHFFFYDSVVRFDHQSGLVETTNPVADDYFDLFDEPFEKEPNLSNCPAGIVPTVSKEAYFENVWSIKNHIKEGDIYQANYTCRFDIETNANPYHVYQKLRKLNPAPYAAYLNFGDLQIISSSPERMFKRTGDFITSCPIKGTVPSGNDKFEREHQRQKLLNSSKDKAELLMIVDLMRNDLGKIAVTGSVAVSNLFTAEVYSSLIHLVADVSAKLKKEVDYLDIFSALMPGGSITGAPKKRAIEILGEHESAPRGVYSGCIGYVQGNSADFNIAIRTVIHQDGLFHVQAGGGIVADSDPESEYQEMQLKAGNLFKAIGACIG